MFAAATATPPIRDWPLGIEAPDEVVLQTAGRWGALRLWLAYAEAIHPEVWGLIRPADIYAELGWTRAQYDRARQHLEALGLVVILSDPALPRTYRGVALRGFLWIA